MADPRDLVTIVGNLLDNALDAAAGGQPPTVGPARGRHGHRGRRRGAGDRRRRQRPRASPPDAAEHAFERGWTTKPTDRPLGRGLGLALVAQAVHRLGGSIEVGNDVGAVFAVRVPRSRHARTQTPGAGVAEPAGPARIAVHVST